MHKVMLEALGDNFSGTGHKLRKADLRKVDKITHVFESTEEDLILNAYSRVDASNLIEETIKKIETQPHRYGSISRLDLKQTHSFKTLIDSLKQQLQKNVSPENESESIFSDRSAPTLLVIDAVGFLKDRLAEQLIQIIWPPKKPCAFFWAEQPFTPSEVASDLVSNLEKLPLNLMTDLPTNIQSNLEQGIPVYHFSYKEGYWELIRYDNDATPPVRIDLKEISNLSAFLECRTPVDITPDNKMQLEKCVRDYHQKRPFYLHVLLTTSLKTYVSFGKNYECLHFYLSISVKAALKKHEVYDVLIDVTEKGEASRLDDLIESNSEFLSEIEKMALLHIACEKGHLECLQLLLAKIKFDLNGLNQDGYTVLMVACLYQQQAIITFLVESAGAQIDYTTQDGKSALTIAVMCGYEEIALYFLQKDPKSLEVALQNLTFLNTLEILLSLPKEIAEQCFSRDKLFNAQKSRMDLRKIQGEKEIAPSIDMLMLAANHPVPKLVECLIALGCDVSFNYLESTPLSVAILADQFEIIQILLDNGADPNINHVGNSYLHLAVLFNKIQSVELILSHQMKAKIDEPNEKGYTPLALACLKGHLEIAKLLYQRGADLNCILTSGVFEGNQPIHLACLNNQFECVQWLLSVLDHSKINTTNHKNQTPLMMTIYQANENILKALLKIPTIALGEEAMHHACRTGSVECVRLLLEKNPACIETLDQEDRTPLMIACAHNHIALARYFIEDKNVDINYVSVRGETALSLSIAMNQVKLTDYLLSQGAKVKYNLQIKPLYDLFQAKDKKNQAASGALSKFIKEIDKESIEEFILMVPEIEISLLSLACLHDNPELIQLLLHDKPDLDGDGIYPSPLKVAIFFNRMGVIQTLLNSGAKISSALLKECVEKGSFAVMLLFYQHLNRIEEAYLIDEQDFLEKIQNHHQHKTIQDAYIYYQLLAELSPSSVNYQNFASIAYAKRELLIANEYFLKALNLDQNNIAALVCYAYFLMRIDLSKVETEHNFLDLLYQVRRKINPDDKVFVEFDILTKKNLDKVLLYLLTVSNNQFKINVWVLATWLVFKYQLIIQKDQDCARSLLLEMHTYLEKNQQDTLCQALYEYANHMVFYIEESLFKIRSELKSESLAIRAFEMAFMRRLEFQSGLDPIQQHYHAMKDLENRSLDAKPLFKPDPLKKAEKVKGLLENSIPQKLELGSAIGSGDCFFDSVAQGLNQLDNAAVHTIKTLRMACARYASDHPQPWLKDALEKDGDNYESYLERIKYTASDTFGLNFPPIWGRPEVEGRIFCLLFNIRINVLEILDDNMQSFLGCNFLSNLVNTEGVNSKTLSIEEYQDERLIHLVADHVQRHNVPLLWSDRLTPTATSGIDTERSEQLLDPSVPASDELQDPSNTDLEADLRRSFSVLSVAADRDTSQQAKDLKQAKEDPLSENNAFSGNSNALFTPSNASTVNDPNDLSTLDRSMYLSSHHSRI